MYLKKTDKIDYVKINSLFHFNLGPKTINIPLFLNNVKNFIHAKEKNKTLDEIANELVVPKDEVQYLNDLLYKTKKGKKLIERIKQAYDYESSPFEFDLIALELIYDNFYNDEFKGYTKSRFKIKDQEYIITPLAKEESVALINDSYDREFNETLFKYDFGIGLDYKANHKGDIYGLTFKYYLIKSKSDKSNIISSVELSPIKRNENKILMNFSRIREKTYDPKKALEIIASKYHEPPELIGIFLHDYKFLNQRSYIKQ